MAFKLKPGRGLSENKTIRFPLKIVEKIEKVIAGKDITFSGFVIQACEYALRDLDEQEIKEKNNTKEPISNK